MRGLAAAVLLAGCGPRDEALEAWHGAVEVTAATRADGDCDAEPAPVEPETDWLFVAVARGTPDVMSLYWCDGPEDCPPVPWTSVGLQTLQPKRISGTWGQVGLIGETLCSVRWDGVDGTRDGDAVHLEVRGYFRGDLDVQAPEECDALLVELIDTACDTVWTFDGVGGG